MWVPTENLRRYRSPSTGVNSPVLCTVREEKSRQETMKLSCSVCWMTFDSPYTPNRLRAWEQ